ncbi:MAG: ABC transporter substrate-binding protein [Clostridia bacterium]|nr:ABC transporter substrate-binding protein [Clostridia bacterium]
MKRIIALILIVSSVFVLFSCGDKEKEQKNQTSENKKLSFESTISVFAHKPDTLCPLLSASESNNRMLQIVFDGLVGLSKELVAEPCLAEKWQVSEDGKIWTVKLREDVMWHDGSAFEAKDVVYTVRQIKKSEKSIYAYNVSNISDVRAVGEFSVEFELKKPWLNFINLLYFPIIKEHSGDIDGENFQPVGTGPYVFKSKKEDSTYYLVRNDEWWGGKPVTECIQVEILADAETALYALSAGTIDITMATDTNWGKFVDPETTAYSTMESSELTFLGVNHGNVTLKQPEVRRAISSAVNRDEMVDNIMMGYATATRVPAHPGWKVCAESKFDTKQNPEAAKKELEDNGWNKQNGFWDKSIDEEYCKTDFRLIYNEENVIRENIALLVETNLESIGINVVTEKLSYEDYESRIMDGDYDLFVGGVIVSPDINFSFMLDEGNIFGFSGAEMLAARDEISTLDASEPSKVYASVLEKLDAENPIISLFFEQKVLIHNNRIEGEFVPTSFDVYRGIETLKKKEVQE